jgi:putative endonuclease
MVYYVYLIKTLDNFFNKSYVGYTNNLSKRLEKHNNNLGAKSTKGYKWQLIYKKTFYSKNKALSFEYKLKKDRKERLRLIKNFNKNKF